MKRAGTTPKAILPRPAAANIATNPNNKLIKSLPSPPRKEIFAMPSKLAFKDPNLGPTALRTGSPSPGGKHPAIAAIVKSTGISKNLKLSTLKIITEGTSL